MIILDVWGNDSSVSEKPKCSQCQVEDDNLKAVGSQELCKACYTEAARKVMEITPQLEIVPGVD